MTAASREYQGRITGRPYSVAEGWSEEWIWLGTDFDGFVPAECLLQEAKGGYGQFLEFDEDADELRPVSWFRGFRCAIHGHRFTSWCAAFVPWWSSRLR
ncbi:Tox-REase-5 domain-containing protein [Burkholderia multivorans]|uniref:Tox-REase-5 domain-containing protein n=1 Tax=Burkholderia multivorans TaxID=87883 RepID=UPI003262E24C